MTESVRLSKRMSELGLCSRREADEWIERGWVRVDGEVVALLGSKVLPSQKITVERQAAAEQSKRATILLNKLVGYVSGQAEDGHKHAISLVTEATHWKEDRSDMIFHPTQLRSLVAAGRLDIDSVGLLVLTQDGRIAKQLIGEDSTIEKEYLVRVTYSKPDRLPERDLQLLNHGMTMDGKPLKPAKVKWLNDDQLSFTLREGKKRQIRRMCEAVGLKVVGLKRVRIGGVKLGDLPAGQWRYLTPDEDFSAAPRGLAPSAHREQRLGKKAAPPAAKVAGRSPDKAMGRPVGESFGKPAGKPASRPSEKPVDRPAGKWAKKPIEKPVAAAHDAAPSAPAAKNSRPHAGKTLSLPSKPRMR